MPLTLKYNKIILFGLMLILLFLMAAPAVLAAEQTGAEKAKSGLDTTAKGGYGVTVLPEDDLSLIVGKIIGAGLALLGVIFFIIIVYAGISWMMAMGKEEKINEAKDMIVAAILGLIVVLAAYAITIFIGNIFTRTI